MRNITWLHLSDWHQRGEDFDRRIVRDSLIADLENRSEIDGRLAEIDFIVFSGDLAFGGEEKEYEAATREFLDPILQSTGVPKNRLVLVPGNHDLHRPTLGFLRPFQFKDRRAVSQALVNQETRRILLQPMENYTHFTQRFLGADAVTDPAYGFLKSLEVRGIRIAIIGINSSWMCGQKVENGEVNDYGCLIVGEPQFYGPMQEPEFKKAHVRIGVLHHPFPWLSDLVRRSLVKRTLTKGFHFLLRGHEHEGDVGIESGTGGPCVVLSAGAAYDHREHPNGYNFVHLDLDTGEGTVFLRRYDIDIGFHKDTITTDDETPGFHQFVLPKKLGRQVASSAAKSKLMSSSGPTVSVYLVRDHRSPDVLAALDLYDERIPEGERIEAPDIVRWLREDQDALAAGRPAENYFYVAKLQDWVCGFALLHWHPRQQLALIAYLVAEKGAQVDKGLISAYLMSEMARLFQPGQELADCRGILFEVDDPRLATDEDDRSQRIARIRLFCMLGEREGFTLRAMDVDYRQPLLRIPDEGEQGGEIPMILMYAQRPAVGAVLPRRRAEEILAFVYKWLYPESFSEIPEENQAYQRYLDRFYEAQVKRLPDPIPMLGFSQIRSRCSTRRKDQQEIP